MKEVVMYFHHAIEILFKDVLYDKCPILNARDIQSEIDRCYRDRMGRSTENSEDNHTSAFLETVKRMIVICGLPVDSYIYDKFERLNWVRNAVMHNEVDLLYEHGEKLVLELFPYVVWIMEQNLCASRREQFEQYIIMIKSSHAKWRLETLLSLFRLDAKGIAGNRQNKLLLSILDVPAPNLDSVYKSDIREWLENQVCWQLAVFLSGGMDSAILASYMPKGTRAYTARCVGTGTIDETQRAAEYCKAYGLEHIIVDVTWEDYLQAMKELALHDGSPIVPNEPQAYLMAKRAKADGVDCIVYGDCADTEFGGMTKLLAKDWDYDGFVERFTFLDPKRVMKNPANVSEIYEAYKKGKDGIDFISFIAGPYAVSAAGALTNAMDAVGLKFIDPYEHCCLGEPLDLARVRSGDSKYLIRDLFRLRYPNMEVPEKLPMSRPADTWMKDWEGPHREEFLPGCIEGLTGEQKLLLFSLERFMDLMEV